MDAALAATSAMALANFTDQEVAALNYAVSGFGHVPEANLSFKLAVDAGLIQSTGHLWDREALEAALSSEVVARQEAGTWGK